MLLISDVTANRIRTREYARWYLEEQKRNDTIRPNP